MSGQLFSYNHRSLRQAGPTSIKSFFKSSLPSQELVESEDPREALLRVLSETHFLVRTPKCAVVFVRFRRIPERPFLSRSPHPCAKAHNKSRRKEKQSASVFAQSWSTFWASRSRTLTPERQPADSCPPFQWSAALGKGVTVPRFAVPVENDITHD